MVVPHGHWHDRTYRRRRQGYIDNTAATLVKETGINKDIILNKIDKAHPIGCVENGKQLRIVKFRSFKKNHFKEVIYKKHKQRKKDNASKRNKNNQPVKVPVPINLQPSLTKFCLKLLQFTGEKFEDIRHLFFQPCMATLRLC